MISVVSAHEERLRSPSPYLEYCSKGGELRPSPSQERRGRDEVSTAPIHTCSGTRVCGSWQRCGQAAGVRVRRKFVLSLESGSVLDGAAPHHEGEDHDAGELEGEVFPGRVVATVAEGEPASEEREQGAEDRSDAHEDVHRQEGAAQPAARGRTVGALRRGGVGALGRAWRGLVVRCRGMGGGLGVWGWGPVVRVLL